MMSVIVIIFSQHLLPLRPPAYGGKLMIHAGNASPHTSRKYITFCTENTLRLAAQRLYSPDRAPDEFFLFGMLSTAWRQRRFDQAKNYLKELVRSSTPSHQRLCTASLSTGWRDSDDFLRPMVTAIHKLNSSQ
jgi:hypothetical protein